MGERDPHTVTSTLRELSRKELVRPARQSSMAGEAEYFFSHILARDVAYGQLPRASRADPPCGGRSLDRVEGARAGRRPGRRARLPLRHRPRPRPSRRTDRTGDGAGAPGHCASSSWPGNAPSGWTPLPPWRVSSGRSRSHHPGIRNVPRRSHTSARPPLTPDASARRRRRWRRRSPPSRPQAKSVRPPGRWAGSATCSGRLADPRAVDAGRSGSGAAGTLATRRGARRRAHRAAEPARRLQGRNEAGHRLRRTGARPR